jgi:hypothetical protein
VSTDRLDSALAAIDDVNAEHPPTLEHSRRVHGWVRRLRPDGASDALLLAARACHVRRWEVPRSSYPDGRAGYLKWRRDLYRRQADIAASLVREAGYDDDTAARVADLVAKRTPRASDPDAQTLEDALCLVFVETEYADLAARTDPQKMAAIVDKTVAKMSPEARKEAAELGLSWRV